MGGEGVAEGVEHVRGGRIGFGGVPGAFLRRSAICVSGLALIVYHRTVMVWAMNVKGTLR